MKYKLLCILSCFVSYMLGQEKLQLLTIQKLDSVIIQTVDWDILTASDVSCEEFSSSFDCVETYLVKDSISLESLQKVLREIQYKDENLIDTRCKIYFFIDDNIKSVCLSNHSIQIGDEFYKGSSSLKKMIKELVEKDAFHLTAFSEKLDMNFPHFPGGIDSIYNYIGKRIFEIDKYALKDRMRLFIKFDINQKGEAIDIQIIDRTNDKLDITFSSEIGNILYGIVKDELKWTASDWRPEKIRKVIPLVLSPN